MAYTQALLTPEFLVFDEVTIGAPRASSPKFGVLTPHSGLDSSSFPRALPVFFLVAFSFVACARSFCCTDRVLLRFPCTYNRSADCVRSARTHHIPSHPIPSHHILYILVLELERTFFSSSFSHSSVGFFVSSDIWSFLMLSLPSRAVRRQ